MKPCAVGFLSYLCLNRYGLLSKIIRVVFFPFLAHQLYNRIYKYGTIIFLLLAVPLPGIGTPILYYLVGVPSAYVFKFISIVFGI